MTLTRVLRPRGFRLFLLPALIAGLSLNCGGSDDSSKGGGGDGDGDGDGDVVGDGDGDQPGDGDGDQPGDGDGDQPGDGDGDGDLGGMGGVGTGGAPMGGMGGMSTGGDGTGGDGTGGDGTGGQPPVLTPTHFLPASGQTACTFNDSGWAWDATCSGTYVVGDEVYPLGQDAHHQADYPAIDLEATDSGDTITDQVTGLVWQRCSAGQSQSADACTGTASTQSHADALTYCSELTLADRSWRLPSAVEYSTILDWGVFGPVLDPTFFPDNPSSARYWTSSGDETSRYIQWMFGGDLTAQTVGASRSVRCVSGEPFLPELETTVSGTVRDTKTLLELTQCPLVSGGATPVVGTEPDCSDSGLISGWESAIEACENLEHAGNDDWRLISARDLGYFHDMSDEGALNSAFFPGVAGRYLYTSTSGPNNESGGAAVAADPGLIRGNQGKGANQFIYCIRGGGLPE